MSKFKKYGMITLCICLCLAAGGCGRDAYAVSHVTGEDHGTQGSSHSQSSQEQDEASGQESSIPGSYTVPDGWVVASDHSTDEKIFYVEDGHEHDSRPDNISINVGKNRYAADESEDFKDAIMRQLAIQIGNSDAQLDGYGSTTDAGDVEYVFTITDDDGSVTKQYYIVGDRRFCLIQLSNYTGSDAADDAAAEMADSFVWDD